MLNIELKEILNNSLNVLIEQFIKENTVLNEVTNSISADDGPGTWIDYFNYKKNSATATERLGYEILSYMIDKKDYNKEQYREYPNGPVKAISFGPAGAKDKLTTQNQIDLTSSNEIYNKWKEHIEKITKQLAWTFIDWYDPSIFEDKF